MSRHQKACRVSYKKKSCGFGGGLCVLVHCIIEAQYSNSEVIVTWEGVKCIFRRLNHRRAGCGKKMKFTLRAGESVSAGSLLYVVIQYCTVNRSGFDEGLGASLCARVIAVLLALSNATRTRSIRRLTIAWPPFTFCTSDSETGEPKRRRHVRSAPVARAPFRLERVQFRKGRKITPTAVKLQKEHHHSSDLGMGRF